jgi:hypothetical protein
MVPCCMNPTINTPVLSQKTVAISFLTYNACLNFFGLSGECVCIHCFDCFLGSTFTNEIQVSSPVAHMMGMRSASPFLWYHSGKVKAKAIFCICAHPRAFLEPILDKACDSLFCDNLIQKSA